MHNTDPEAAPSNAPQPSASPAPKPHVLVVDDSRLVRISIKKVIDAEFTVIEAGDGEEGWEKLLADTQIQVVLTDAGMPKLDGFEFIERIRQTDDQRVAKIPVIMITGAEAAETHVKEKAMGAGATDFITKPFDKTQLLARVRGYVKANQTQCNLVEQSAMDPLTKARNHRYFLQRGDQELALAKRHQQDLAIIALGIDNFVDVHRQCGKETTEGVLIWAKKLIESQLRKEDTLARIDGAYFAIIAPNTGRMEAAVVGERIRKIIHTEIYGETVIALHATASVGIACLGRETIESTQDFLGLALKRVKEAQSAGGNRVQANCKVTPRIQPNLSIDQALKYLASGKDAAVRNHLPSLLMKIAPLLEVANSEMSLGIEELLKRFQSGQ